MGVYQAVLDFPSDNIFFLSASYRNELSKTEVLEKVKQKEYDLIFIDEYSWFSENKWDRDDLSGYLAGKSMEGVKVIISGTDSTKIHSLLCTDFIHRAVELNTTYFSYDEYCRLFELKKNDGSMKSFLTQGVFLKTVHAIPMGQCEIILNLPLSKISGHIIRSSIKM